MLQLSGSDPEPSECGHELGIDNSPESSTLPVFSSIQVVVRHSSLLTPSTVEPMTILQNKLFEWRGTYTVLLSLLAPYWVMTFSSIAAAIFSHLYAVHTDPGPFRENFNKPARIWISSCRVISHKLSNWSTKLSLMEVNRTSDTVLSRR